MDVLGKHAVLQQILRNCFEVFLEVFVHSTLWMSLSLASLVPFVQLECGGVAALDWRPFWVGAAESVAVYTLDHLRDISKATALTGSNKVGNQSGIARHRAKFLRVLMVIALAGFFGSLAFASSWRVAATFIGHLALCVVYAKLKKRMPYLKAAYVSLCVVFMGVAAPAAYAPGLLSTLAPAALARLCFLIFSVSFTVEHLQDLRDVDEDREAGVVTIPSGLGPRRAARALLAVQAVSLGLHGALAWAGSLPLRSDLIFVHSACFLAAVFFNQKTPRSLFQVALEPLYAAPLGAAVVARVSLAALGAA